VTGLSFTAEPGRLDMVVARHLGISRADAQRAIAQARIKVDGVARTKAFRLAGGEEVSGEIAGVAALMPEAGGVPVLYQDEWLMVVSKPPGMPTHPASSFRTGTLVNRLVGMDVPLSSRVGEESRPGIVHRLDAGTSGLMIVAKDDGAHRALADMFRRHAVDRRYLALVRGHLEHEEITIDARLARHRARIRVRAATGKEAATEVRVLESLGGTTLVEARPRTGRTHQIRVHLSAIGHPVLGDTRYGGGGQDSVALGLTRPFLHSWRIGFDHPLTGARIDLEDPLPPDLERALERARSG
jgi:23S rRNA pseudouridine1911/1915/1917 synthase